MSKIKVVISQECIPTTTIGFDRKLEIEWLDAVAGRAAAGDTPEEIRTFLWNFLDGVVAGNSVPSGRGKTLTVLSRIWVIVPERARHLREAALRCLASATPEQRVAIHWAMAIGTYPFFCDVAGNVGRLLELNEQVNLSQLARAPMDLCLSAARSTLPRAIQRVLRSMVQRGVLRDGPVKGAFVASSRRIDLPDAISELLLQAILVSTARGMPLSCLTGHPALFPFDVQVSAAALRKSGRLHADPASRRSNRFRRARICFSNRFCATCELRLRLNSSGCVAVVGHCECVLNGNHQS